MMLNNKYSHMTYQKFIGQTTIKPQHRATCHCGRVELLLELPDGLVDLRRCNCSMCARRGAIVISAPLNGLQIINGETLTLYQFNTFTAKHYFCRVCGIYTHHQRRSDPAYYGVNVACLDNVNPADFEEIPWVDGRNAHPSDH